MDGSQFPMRLRASTTRNHAPNEPRVEVLAPKGEDHDVEHADDERRDEPSKGMLRRHPLAFVGGLILLFVALPTGYVYWDYASHYESTDDAFIAARQFPIAPKVPGYLTAVPVTDDEHVVAGHLLRLRLRSPPLGPISRISMRRSLCSRPRSVPTRRRATRRKRRSCLLSSRPSATRS